jgi:hypothetical protein
MLQSSVVTLTARNAFRFAAPAALLITTATDLLAARASKTVPRTPVLE